MDKAFVGDCNQTSGIGNALIRACEKKNLRYSIKKWYSHNSNISEIEGAFTHKQNTKKIIISSGSFGLNAFSQESPDTDNIYTIWTGHQVFDGLKNIIGKIDILALPKHAITESFRKIIKNSKNMRTKLVETNGVAHNLQKHDLFKANNNWIGERFLQAPSYIGVFLGGDAPTPDGTIRYFTQEEARLLGQLVAQKAKKSGSCVLITNGPRTGKHDKTSGAVNNFHKKNSQIDPVSMAFIQSMQENNATYQFFDFKFGVPSAYKAILATLMTTPNSQAFVTGESASMVSELCDFMPTGQTYVVSVNSMNRTHKAFVRSMHEAKRINWVHPNAQIIEHPGKLEKSTENISAAETIARYVIAQILKYPNK